MKTFPLKTFVLTCSIVSSLVSTSQAALPFSDNFSASHNYSGGNVSGTGWDGVLNSGTLTLGTAGSGVLNWGTSGQWESGVSTASFLYIQVTGDFSATVQAHEVSGSFPVGGIMALDPTSLPSNADWSFVDHHVFGNNVFFNSINNFVPGSGNPAVNFSGNAGEYLRLDRTGTLMTAYAKLNLGDAWTQIASVNRADIPSTLYLGLTASGNGSSQFQFSNFVAVPEPSSALLMAGALTMMVLRRRKS